LSLNDQKARPLLRMLPPAPVALPEVELPAWDGASRINILFIGLDARDMGCKEGPPRSDTMMLVTIDPVSKDSWHVIHSA
jgi:hypothetical protein